MSQPLSIPSSFSSHLSNESSLESRFGHLLAPIRDLASNWHIDIATELEDYLQELENISITFDQEDNTQNKLNFAEAALLIQGSTCIYSKKVEYLYNLLYQTLNVLIEKKKKKTLKQQASSIDAEGNDIDFESANFSDEPLLMDLDDTIKESKNIDIEDEDFTTPWTKFNYYKQRQNQLIHRQPLSVLTMNRNDYNTNESKESKDSNSVSSTHSDTKDFRVSNCIVHASGALLLEERDSKLINDKFQRTTLSNSDVNSLSPQQFGSPHSVLAEQYKTSMDSKLNTINQELKVDNHNTELQFDDVAMTTNDDWSDNEADTRPILETKDEKLDEKTMMDDENNAHNQDKKVKKGVRFAEELCEYKEADPLPAGVIDINTIHDPWLQLDPHDSQSIKVKPFKFGKTYRKPPASVIENLNSPASIHNLFNDNNSIQHDLILKSMQKNNLRVPYYSEFIHIFINNLNERKLKRVKQNKITEKEEKQRLIEKIRSQARGEAVNINDNMDNQTDMNIIDQYDTADTNDDFDNEDTGVSNAVIYDTAGFNVLGEDNVPEIDNAWDLPLTSSTSDSTSDSKQLFHELESLHKTYEDLCRDHVESYIRSAEKYLNSNEISVKVNEWQNKLQPILEEQANHPTFDIQVTGKELIQTIQTYTQNNNNENNEDNKESNEIIDFSTAVAGKQHYEVCRMFLAALQLANNGNVEIEKSLLTLENQTTQSMKLTLLSDQWREDHMQDWTNNKQYVPVDIEESKKNNSTISTTSNINNNNNSNNIKKADAMDISTTEKPSKTKGKRAASKGRTVLSDLNENTVSSTSTVTSNIIAKSAAIGSTRPLRATRNNRINYAEGTENQLPVM